MGADDTTTTTTPDVEPVELDDLQNELVALQLLKAEKEKIEAAIKALRERVTERMGEAEEGTVSGHVWLRMPHRTVTRVDVPKLRADVGDELLAAQGFLKITTERRFELVQ